ncbi:hypothetical protein Belba_3059 [Belliella baltica DSM 15883]|uniref:Uncharacterized protein n=1 Tax=Belliella baltica (strain DSM 15883 / CIP 108006 / LMG 21964 / BA134) TaxID=866536 RepID=I3Z8K8_BELBD|nr:hypothetical protein [Belliella baltica]AFL85576.1 hypothetical protein Belba_3059 [Belliella baltica DSM 15883]
MAKIKKLRKKWLYSSVGGILLMGFGLSLFRDAVILKFESKGFFDWFLSGTIALGVFFSGLSLFGSAINFKSQMDSYKIKKRQKRINKK